MKKTITTILIVLLAGLSASAQVYRSGGIGGFGTTTSYGGKGGSRGGSQGPQGWYIGAGGIYNEFSSTDLDVLDNFGGIGGMLEVGKGSSAVCLELLTFSADVDGGSIDQTNYRAYFKRRAHFAKIFYGYAGFGVMYYNISYNPPSGSGITIEDENEVLVAGNMGLGINFNLGGPLFFIESGISIFDQPENTTISVGPVGGGTLGGQSGSGTLQYDGVRAGFRFFLN